MVRDTKCEKEDTRRKGGLMKKAAILFTFLLCFTGLSATPEERVPEGETVVRLLSPMEAWWPPPGYAYPPAHLSNIQPGECCVSQFPELWNIYMHYFNSHRTTYNYWYDEMRSGNMSWYFLYELDVWRWAARNWCMMLIEHWIFSGGELYLSLIHI